MLGFQTVEMATALNVMGTTHLYRDHDGSATSRVASALVRASRPLSIEWVRRFMLQYGDVAGDLSLLTSEDQASNATVLTGVFHTTAHNYGGIALPEQSLTASCLLLPCVTVGNDTVGLVVQREGRTSDGDGSELGDLPGDVEVGALLDLLIPPGSQTISDHEHSIGRFYFSNESGELLMLSHLLPAECDMTMTALSLLSLNSGDLALPIEHSASSRTRLSWWCPLDNEKLTAVVDTALFEAGMHSQSILVANHSRNAARLACAECSKSALLQTALNGCVQLSKCACKKSLFVPETTRDFKLMFANIRTSQCGLWAGAAEELSRLLWRPGSFVIARQSMSMSLEFDGDVMLGASLRGIAIAQCVSQAFVPRPVVSSSEDIGGLPPEIACGHGAVAHCGAVSSLDLKCCENLGTSPVRPATSPVASTLGLPGVDKSNNAFLGCECFHSDVSALKLDLCRGEVAEARRHRNRLAAARSNAKRKARNDELKQALSTSLRRVDELRRIQHDLQSQNVLLRKQLESM